MRNLFYILRTVEIVLRLATKPLFWFIFVAAVLVFIVLSPVFAFEGTFTDMTASRSADVTYQNTSGNDLIVIASCEMSEGSAANADALIGVASANTTVAGITCSPNSNSQRNNITFIVPVDYYYRISGGSGWYEWWEYTTPEAGGGGGGDTVVHNPTQDLWNGVVLFFLVFFFFIWFFRRPYDTF